MWRALLIPFGALSFRDNVLAQLNSSGRVTGVAKLPSPQCRVLKPIGGTAWDIKSRMRVPPELAW